MSMTISSRTPEGSFNRCPVCGKVMNITPSEPSGDATCPHCGSLVWFVVTDAGVLFYSGLHLVLGDKRAMPPVPRPKEFRSMEFADESQVPDDLSPGDLVLIVDGYFKDIEGEVESIDHATAQVVVRIDIFGRIVPVVVETRQLKKMVRRPSLSLCLRTRLERFISQRQ